jgi:hypothetical protein
MNTKTTVAVLLITLGIVVLAYSGISFTTPGKPVEFLGRQACSHTFQKHRERRHPATTACRLQRT